MKSPEPAIPARQSLAQTWGWALGALVSFHLAYVSVWTSWLVLLYLFALIQLTQATSWRRAIYPGLVVGLGIGIGRLTFFWNIFGAGAVALWLVYAFWIALFVVLVRWVRLSFPLSGAWLPIVPFIWCGLEYFRSELYYLRFSWLSPGFAFAEGCWQPVLAVVGVYGLGFVLCMFAASGAWSWPHSKARVLIKFALYIGLLAGVGWAHNHFVKPSASRSVKIAGVQLEFPTEADVLRELKLLTQSHPEAELIVLSEYSFGSPIPNSVKKWCRDQHKYLIAGGQHPIDSTNYFNTAFVVAPSGDIVFEQAKCVPIQFFKDGRPAPRQQMWSSPWGKIGICICYDLSYRRVTDALVSQGAEALIVPTMDVADWGAAQHALHARVAPVRSAELRVPIFRLASSGISQLTDRDGHVLATAPFPGETEFISGELRLNGPGRLPLDFILGPVCVGVTALAILVCWIKTFAFRNGPKPPRTPPRESVAAAHP